MLSDALLEHVQGPGHAAEGGGGDLRIGRESQRRARGVDRPSDGSEHAKLGHALELAHAGTLERVATDHRRIGVKLFEELDDGQGLGQEAAVAQLEDRKRTQGMASQVFGFVLLASG